MKNAEFLAWLRRHRADTELLDWVGQRSAEQAWQDCDRADRMLWIYTRWPGMDRRTVVSASCDCAETALRYVRPGEHRPQRAIEAARWRIADPTDENKEAAGVADAAASAAYAAYADAKVAAAAYADAKVAATYADYADAKVAAAACADAKVAAAADAAAYAAYAAYAVAYAAYAADDAAAYVAAYAAYAAAYYAAYAVADAAAANAAVAAGHRTMSALIRRRIPSLPDTPAGAKA